MRKRMAGGTVPLLHHESGFQCKGTTIQVLSATCRIANHLVMTPDVSFLIVSNNINKYEINLYYVPFQKNKKAEVNIILLFPPASRLTCTLSLYSIAAPTQELTSGCDNLWRHFSLTFVGQKV